MAPSNATPENWDQLDELEETAQVDTADEEEVAEESAEETAEAEEAEAETGAAEGEPDPEADDTGAAETVSAETESPSVEADETVEGGPTETPDEPVEAAPSPFKFRAHGQEFAIPDAQVVEEDGTRKIVMTEKAFQEHIHPRIQDPSSWERTRQRLERQVQELDPGRNDKVIRAQTIMDTIDPLLAEAEKGNTGPLYEWLDEATKNAALLRARAEANVYKAQAEVGTRERQAEQQSQDWEATVPLLQDALRANAEKVLGLEEFKGLGLKADDDLVETLWTMWEQGAPVFVEVTEETQERYGVKPGTYVNNEYLATYLRPTAKTLRAERKRRADAAAAEKANNKALGKGGKKPPTTAPAKGGAAPEKADDEPDDYQAWVESLR